MRHRTRFFWTVPGTSFIIRLRTESQKGARLVTFTKLSQPLRSTPSYFTRWLLHSLMRLFAAMTFLSTSMTKLTRRLALSSLANRPFILRDYPIAVPAV